MFLKFEKDIFGSFKEPLKFYLRRQRWYGFYNIITSIIFWELKDKRGSDIKRHSRLQPLPSMHLILFFLKKRKEKELKKTIILLQKGR